MSDGTDLQEVFRLGESFASRAQDELSGRLTKWPTDLSMSNVHEVVGSLLARNVTLASQIVQQPPLWNAHVAPLMLRAMADVYINLAWVLGAPIERCTKFIHYGLGQEKLQLEHRRAEMAARSPSEEEVASCNAIEDWINTQRAIFLTDVNLGSWSGLSTRAMAEEADCIDFYNFVYVPFSACAHSMWQHVARYNLKPCQNPLHRLHSVPTAAEAPLDVHFAYLAAKYLQKSFAKFDSAMGISLDGQSAFDFLCQALDGFDNRQDGAATE